MQEETETALYYVTPSHWEAFQARHVVVFHRDGSPESGGYFHVLKGHAHGRFDTAEDADAWGSEQIPRLVSGSISQWAPNVESGLKPYPVEEQNVPEPPSPEKVERVAQTATVLASAYLGLRDALTDNIAETVEDLCTQSVDNDLYSIEREQSGGVVQLTYHVAGHELLHVTISRVKGN